MSIKRPIKRGNSSGPSPGGPVFTVQPAITGNYYVDDTLTCDGGTVDDGSAAKFYQWQADGYDKVECLEHNPSDADFPGCHVVKVKFLERSALIDDFFFESPDYSGLYIEEIV